MERILQAAVLAAVAAEDLCGLAQDLVAGRVAVGVVEMLESVQVEEQDSDAQSFHFRTGQERLERLQASFTGSIIVGHYNKLLLDEGAILLGEIYLNDLAEPDRAIAALSGLLKRQRTSLLCDDALYLMAEAAQRRHGGHA